MKSNKMAKLASVFLSASIAVMTTACTVEFSGTDETLESVTGMLTEMQAGSNDQDQGTEISVDPSDSNTNTDIGGNTVESNESLNDITGNEDIGQNSGTGNSGTSGSSGNSGVIYVTVTPNKPNMPDNNGQVNSGTNSTEAETSSGNSNADEPKSSESKSTVTATPTPTPKVTSTPKATPTATPTVKPTATPEVQRPLIKENTCIVFEQVSGQNQTYTLDCKHGNFKVEPGNNDILITFNGNTFELPITWSSNLGVWPYSPVYVQIDGNEYIYIGSSLQTTRGFYHNLNIYKITGNEVTYIASTDGLSVLSQNMSDPKCFEASLKESEENGFDLRGLYEVGPDGIPVLMDDDQWFFDVCDAVSFPEKVSGHLVIDESVTVDIISVSPDEYVRLVGTDGMTYLDIETKAGVRIRLDWTSIFQACDYSDQFYVAHAIDANIDDRIPCYDF